MLVKREPEDRSAKSRKVSVFVRFSGTTLRSAERRIIKVKPHFLFDIVILKSLLFNCYFEQVFTKFYKTTLTLKLQLLDA